MSRRLRSNKSSQQIKEEQINFLLEDVEKNLDDYKKALELKDKQLSDVKRILQNAKISYNSVIRENQELKKFIENIKIRYQQYQQQQQQKYLDREREYFSKERERQPKRYKKVVYEEEPDSEPEVDENEYLSEEIEENVEKPKLEKKKNNNKKEKIPYSNI